MMMMMVVVVMVVVVVVKATGRHMTFRAGLREFFKKNGKASKHMDSTLKV
jgi:hypothetical protein